MSGPLASLKVLDFSTLLPGPFATLMLADMGAEVLRVESPTRPDMVRLLPPSGGWWPRTTLSSSSSAPGSWTAWAWATKTLRRSTRG